PSSPCSAWPVAPGSGPESAHPGPEAEGSAQGLETVEAPCRLAAPTIMKSANRGLASSPPTSRDFAPAQACPFWCREPAVEAGQGQRSAPTLVTPPRGSSPGELFDSCCPPVRAPRRTPTDALHPHGAGLDAPKD